jgi:hypothetical protein
MISRQFGALILIILGYISIAEGYERYAILLGALAILGALRGFRDYH